MSVEAYFINETKKQILSTKKLSGYFEYSTQLICYLNICMGDTITTCYENERTDEILFCGNKDNYKKINLSEFEIYEHDCHYETKEFERFEKVINNQ